MKFAAALPLLLAALVVLAACRTPPEGTDEETSAAWPEEQAEAPQPEPAPRPEIESRKGSVGLVNAPPGSRLLIDGVDVGPAPRFDGRSYACPVEPGLRRIQVVDETGTVMFTRDQVFGPDTAKIYMIRKL